MLTGLKCHILHLSLSCVLARPYSFLFSGLPLEVYSWHLFSFFGCVNETANNAKDVKAGKKDPVRGLGLVEGYVFVCLAFPFWKGEGKIPKSPAKT